MKRVLDFLVVIPTYKRRASLLAAITSVLAQTAATKQIVVADDCPVGSASEVARSFPEVIYLKNPQPSGGWPGRVRNFAFDSTREMGISSDYVHFLDDDDTVPEGHYAAVMKAFDRQPDIGVVFGVLRPFCMFSDDSNRRERQERQLQAVREWRVRAARFPWLYEQIGAALRCPAVTQWLYSQHATFGPEMFLCSGGIIRYDHVVELQGFPDVRITQDYWFYTEAIRKFGALSLRQETAGYGVGNSGAIWNPLDLNEKAKAAHTNEWMQELRARGKNLRAEMGYPKYYSKKAIFLAANTVIGRVMIPALDRSGWFADLYRLVDPDRVGQSVSAGDKISQ